MGFNSGFKGLKKYDYLEFLGHLGNRFIVGGDFNVKNTQWGSRLTTTKCRELLRAIQETRCEAMSTGKPTYWPTDPGKIHDPIDFFIIKNIPAQYLQIEESHGLKSDHTPIHLTLTLRSLTLYIYGAPILHVSRSHTTTQHSR